MIMMQLATIGNIFKSSTLVDYFVDRVYTPLNELLKDSKRFHKKNNDTSSSSWEQEIVVLDVILSDTDLFDKAYSSNDVESFVKLIQSEEPIGVINQKIHPWADDPKTIGALAITQLAILAAKDDEPQYRDRIRKAGALPLLVANLSSKELDRQHASFVALSFLSVENTANCRELYCLGALPLLIQGLSNPLEGLRGASAQICRNIYVLGQPERKDFQKHGGLEALISLLSISDEDLSSPSENADFFNQLEAVYHLEDYILDKSEEIPGMVNEMVNAGAIPPLQRLTHVPNEDVREAAQYLLARLTTH